MSQTKLITFFLSFFFISQISAQENYVKFGGAVRYNFFFTSYESNTNANDLQFTWDTWRLNIKARQKGIDMDFEYRFYPTFGTHFIHHGWFGLELSKSSYLKIGVHQVPFGNLKYASHSWWFVTPYYVGLEDDYDIGFKLNYKVNNWIFDFAYYLQPEPSGPAPNDISYGIGGSGRYSYDIIPSGNQTNQEKNQFNFRAAYNFEHNKNNTEIGISAQYGMIYNSVIDEFNGSYAFAGHLNGNYSKFNIKAEYLIYKFDIKDDEGNLVKTVNMGAYGSGTYPVASEASMGVIGVSYDIPVAIGPISNITFYNDYTITQKAEEEFADTHQNILGAMVTAGSIYAYFDIAMGKNQPWLTDNFGKGLGAGDPDAEWNIRYNVNIGYYF